MKDETIFKVVRDHAQKAREQLKGATLFGRPIDVNSAEHVLALYWVQHSQMQSMKKGLEFLRSVKK